MWYSVSVVCFGFLVFSWLFYFFMLLIDLNVSYCTNNKYERSKHSCQIQWEIVHGNDATCKVIDAYIYMFMYIKPEIFLTSHRHQDVSLYTFRSKHIFFFTPKEENPLNFIYIYMIPLWYLKDSAPFLLFV